MDLIEKCGILFWPILFCSLAGTAIFFERLLSYRSAATVHRHLLLTTWQLLKERRRETALQKIAALKARSDFKMTPDLRIIGEGLAVDINDRKTLELVLSHSVSREMSFLERHLGTMATMASLAPLLGLLGTVFGMIKAFMAIEKLGGRVNASVLAGGIWEAMLTTAFGLVVAIPLIVLHSYLENRLQTIRAIYEEIAVSMVKACNGNEEG